MLTVIVSLVIVKVLSSRAQSLPNPTSFIPNPTYIFSKALSCYENPNSDGSCPWDDITFWLYTKNQLSGVQITRENLHSLPVEEGRAWKIIFHGLNSDKDDSPGIYLKEAYFSRGSYNLLLVDYRGPFMRNRTYLCYPWAATDSLDLVASCSVQFFVPLLTAGILPELTQWHVLGHSLGTHTAASVCNRLADQGYGKVARLTGLDPAGPLFWGNFTSSIRLIERGDAVFVDAYHSNGGDAIRQFGTKENRADVDVRFNGGGLQPGCNGEISCNHQRAVDYYAESIFPKPPNNHVFKGHRLNMNLTSEHILVGEDISLNVRGVLFVTTNAQSPFAQD